MNRDEWPPDEHPAPERLHGTAFWLLGRAARKAERVTQQHLTEAGMRRYFYGVLATLAEFGPDAQAEIGRRLGVDPSDMVAVLNDLETLNYVVRTVDSKDRRRNRVELTKLGAKALDRFDVAIAEAERDLLDRLPDDSRRDLIQLLRNIAFD